MAPRKPPAREQEQSIRDRKATLFEEAEPEGPTVARRPFAEHLRTTPPAPLPRSIRTLLWAVGLVVVALLVIALVRTS